MDATWEVYDTEILGKEKEYTTDFWFGFDNDRCLWVGLENIETCHSACDIDPPEPENPVEEVAEDAMDAAEDIVDFIDENTDPYIDGNSEEVLIIILAIVIGFLIVKRKIQPWSN